jgi:transposase InsO family protein
MFVQLLLWMVPLLFLGRRDQCLRVIALQQQLEVYQRQQAGKRLQLTDQDRRFWVMLRKRWPRWRETLVMVKPATVVAWHRKLGRWWQRRQRRPPGRPPMPEEVQALIRRMAGENPFWGQERIAGELGKLGIEVSPRSVAKYMGQRAPGPPSVGWMAFLTAHEGHIWACDWLRVKTVSFRTLYVFVVLAHARRRVVHFHITDQPSDVWVAQQIAEATPFDDVPAFLIRDGDPLYGQTFSRRTWARGIRTIQIPRGRPQCNCYVERLMRTLRQECLRHLIILDERHLRWVLQEYLAYYHRARPHQGLNQETPLPQPRLLSSDASIRCRPILGGLHHEYFRTAA